MKFLKFALLVMMVMFSVIASAKPKNSALVVDASKGLILYEKSASALRYPASLTKMMTIYLAFEAVDSKKIKLSTMLKVSKKASIQPRSNIGLKLGSKISMEDAILSLIIKSANDSAVVIAESISKTEEKFARKMTKRARDLGMSSTTFKNASGLYHKQQKTTAYDMARLAIALKRDYPHYYKLFNRKSFVVNGKKYVSSNKVLKRYSPANGLKTGYIRASGFNLVTSANKNGNDLIGVIFGEKTSKSRDRKMINMLQKHFTKMELASSKKKFKVKKKK